MRRYAVLAAALGALLLPLAMVSAHSGGDGASVAVEPNSITAGDTVTFAGTGLEPDSDRVLVIAGAGLTIGFGTVRTDASGKFAKELTIPDHLPSGSYELRAIGDETLTTSLGVTALAGGTAANAATTSASPMVAPRSRSPLELAALLASAIVIVAAGVVLAWRAERLGGALRAGTTR